MNAYALVTTILMPASCRRGAFSARHHAVAARARVITRTLFRYFPDTEEVLFAESEALTEGFVKALLETADVTSPPPNDQSVTQPRARWASSSASGGVVG